MLEITYIYSSVLFSLDEHIVQFKQLKCLCSVTALYHLVLGIVRFHLFIMDTEPGKWKDAEIDPLGAILIVGMINPENVNLNDFPDKKKVLSSKLHIGSKPLQEIPVSVCGVPAMYTHRLV